MKIAAYLDADGEPASLYQPGSLYLYEETCAGESQRWRRNAKLSFRLDSGTGLNGVKVAVATLVAALDPDCRVLLSGEIRGLPYSVLQEQFGFHTWKSEGSLPRQLDYVRDRETEAQAKKKFDIVLRANQPVPTPIPMSGLPGHYWIDLRAVLDHHSNPTSRNILIPFLTAGRFVKLEVLCDHLPKWMAWELERLDLAAETEEIDATGRGIRVTVHSRATPDGRARKPGLLGGGAPLLGLPCPRELQRQSDGPPGRIVDRADWRKLLPDTRQGERNGE